MYKDHKIPVEQRNKFDHAHFMHEILDIFHGWKGGLSCHVDHEYFMKWMEKLFAALKQRNISNANYKKIPRDTPKAPTRSMYMIWHSF